MASTDGLLPLLASLPSLPLLAPTWPNCRQSVAPGRGANSACENNAMGSALCCNCAMPVKPAVPGNAEVAVLARANVYALSAQGTLLDRSALRDQHRAWRHQAAILTRVLSLTTRYSYSYSPLHQVRARQLCIATQRHVVSSTAPYSRHPHHLAHAMGRAATPVRVCERPTPLVSHAYNQQFDRASGVAIGHR